MLENDTDMPIEGSSSDSGDSPYESIAPIDFEPSGGHQASGLGGHRLVLFGVLALMALLSAFAVYIFSGRSVLIDFDPVADQVDLEGSLLEVKFGGRWLLQPGEYTVRASKLGYYDFEQTFEVGDVPDQSHLFSLVKLPGYLSLNAEPEVQARVWIDGESVGVTPLARHELRPGDYRLSVRAERYHIWEGPLTIEGAQLEQTVTAELEPAWAEVYLSSTPAGATLYVDSEPRGETPLTLEILEGDRQLQLRLDGYKDWQDDLEIMAGQALDLPGVVLTRADNLIQASSNPGGANVTVDGEFRGQTPMQLELAPGQSYRIAFAKAGYQSNQRLLEVVAGDETSLQVRLQPVLGEVMIAGTPADAEVVVDGIPRGNLNERMRLPAHPHRIEVRKQGFEAFTTTVTPNPDLEQRVQVALTSLEAIREARMPDLLTTSTGYQLKLVKPSGIFRMGSGRREQGRRSNEFMRQAQLERPFYIGLKELSNQEYLAFDAQHDSGVIERNTLSLKNQPVVHVSWNQAASFCNWLSAQEGLPAAYTEVNGEMVAVSPMNTGFRLPSEAEWAYVARYGGHSEGRAALRYPWGGNMPPAAGSGNYGGLEAAALMDRSLRTFQDQNPATSPVGEHPPGPLGLYDIGGNVREWMHDYYVIHTAGLGANPVDTLGPEKGTTHAIRGSGWRSASITELRLAYRDDGLEGLDDVGIRLARYAE